MRYNPALDGIRAIAIGLVLARHAQVPGFFGGYIGVDVFFVLSGYLITHILLHEIEKTGTVAMSRFYLGRLQRLYPPTLVLLVAYVVLGPLLWPDLGSPLSHAGVAAVYMSDYAHVLPVEIGKLGYLWSLGVEEKFYLLWPVVLLFIAFRPKPLWWIAGLVVISTGWRFIGWAAGFSWDRLYFTFDAHSSGLVIGSALALYLKHRSLRIGAVPGYLGLAVIFACAHFLGWDTDFSILFGTLVIEMATVALILSVQDGTGWLAARPLAAIGRYSYGIYLWHMPIMVWLRVDHDWWFTLLVGGFLSLLFSMISYHSVEKYFRQLKQRRKERQRYSGAMVSAS